MAHGGAQWGMLYEETPATRLMQLICAITAAEDKAAQARTAQNSKDKVPAQASGISRGAAPQMKAYYATEGKKKLRVFASPKRCRFVPFRCVPCLQPGWELNGLLMLKRFLISHCKWEVPSHCH